jgi:hypothetical protein
VAAVFGLRVPFFQCRATSILNRWAAVIYKLVHAVVVMFGGRKINEASLAD